MGKIAFKLLAIILWNLLAFLSLWLILDALFKTGYVYTLLFIAISFPVLMLILFKRIKKTLSELEKISSDGK